MVDEQLSYSAKAALTERVKELTCLYGIAQIACRPDTSLEEIVQNITELLPPAWQYPVTVHARITLDGLTYTIPGVRDCRQNQTAEIVVDGMPGTGKIIVETKFSDCNVYLTVKDTGISMNKEILDEIFMPFFTTKDVSHRTRATTLVSGRGHH
jgi:hypothetical protein